MITEYNDYCIICGKPAEEHHVFKGRKHRTLCEQDELTLPLCYEHHRTGKLSAHLCKEMNVLCEIIGQLAYERDKCAEGYSVDAARESFLMRYGKAYI